MAIENNDLLVVQKNGGGELRKATVSALLAQGDALWKEDGNAVTPKADGADLTIEGAATFASYLQVDSAGMTGDYNTYINASVGAEYFIASKAPGDLATSPIIWGVKEDGSAVFDGSEASSPVRISKYGSLLVASDTDTLSDARFSVDGGNGDVAFVGTLKKNTSAGALVCAIDDDYLRIYDAPASLDDFKISLEKDGSATFAGKIVGEGDGAYLSINRTNISPGTGALLLGFTDGVQKFKVGTDGSGEFAEHFDIGSSTATNAYVRVERSNAGNVFSGNGASGNTSYITDEGKANFGGTSFYTGDTDFQITSSGEVKLGLSSPGNRTYSFAVGSTGNFSIVDESAGGENRMTINGSNSTTTFPKTVVVGQNPSGAQNLGVVTSFEGYIQITGAPDATIWYGYAQGTNVVTSRIYSNGTAEFKNFKLETLDPLPA